MNAPRHPRRTTEAIAGIALVLLFCLALPALADYPRRSFDSPTIPDNTALNIPDAYTRVLPRLCPWEADENLSLPPALREQPDFRRNFYRFRFDDLQIDFIGRWEYFDVFHTFDSNQLHRAVLLRDAQNLWHFLQVSFWDELGGDSLPEIWNLDGRSILASPVKISGNGGWWREEYWVLPPGADWPVLLDVSAPPATARRIVPAGCTPLMRSGHLDLRNFRYSAFVWRPDDGACCPSGGTIEVSLALDGTRVIVADVRWCSSGDEFTASHLFRPVRTSGRQVFVSDGKTGAIPDPFEGCATVREACGKVLPVLYPWAFAPENPQRLSPDVLEASTRMLPPWEGIRMAQVTDVEQGFQALLMELPNSGWHFACLQFGNPADFNIPEQWCVAGRSILAARMPLAGFAPLCEELYWVKDDTSGEPRILDFAELETAEGRACPRNGFTRPRGGKLDLKNLVYSFHIWHPGEEPCCPSGGTIDLPLAIDGTRLTVADARWDPLK